MPQETLTLRLVQNRLCFTDLEIKAHTTLVALTAAIAKAIGELQRKDAAAALTILKAADARAAAYHDACRAAIKGERSRPS